VAGTQTVILGGGSLEGEDHEAPAGASPVLTGRVRMGADRWTELFFSDNGRTVEHADHGSILVLVYSDRLDETPAE
jgi:hypothetical protein